MINRHPEEEAGSFLSVWIPDADRDRLRALCLSLGISPSDLAVLLIRNAFKDEKGPPSGGP